MATRSVTRALAEALAQAPRELPEEVFEASRRALLDWLGSALAGATEPAVGCVRSVAERLGTSSEATVIGGGRASAAAAALANGAAAHVLELDDLHHASTVHPGAPIIPAAVAVAEREHASGRDLLRAIAIGFDAGLRVGEAVNPSHYRFFHPTGTAATFGAAAAAGALIGLDADGMQHAFGSAGTQAAGLWEFNADGANSKLIHAGKAAMNGVISADLAALGFTGASRILEGDRGFFRALAVDADESRITDRLGEHWKVLENGYKLHSCCGHTHTAADLAIGLREEIARRGVRSIDVEIYDAGYAIVKNDAPANPYEAKFSLAYCVATALAEGQLGLEQFSADRFSDGPVRLPRIRTGAAADLSGRYPAEWPARLRITLEDGTVLHVDGDVPRGHPANPASTSELEQKLRDLVSARCGAALADHAIATVRGIDTIEDVSAIEWNGGAQ